MFTKVSQGPFDDDGHFQVIWRQGNFPASRGSSPGETRQTTIFPGKKLEGSFFTGLFQESIKDEKVEYKEFIRVFQFAS